MELVTEIENALDAVRPTLVLSVWSAPYAEADGNTPGVRAGVRGEDDWEIELDGCTVADAQYLLHKYGPQDVSYMVDDSSATPAEYHAAIEAFEAHLASKRNPITCSIADAMQFLLEASQKGNIEVTIDGATWLVAR